MCSEVWTQAICGQNRKHEGRFRRHELNRSARKEMVIFIYFFVLRWPCDEAKCFILKYYIKLLYTVFPLIPYIHTQHTTRVSYYFYYFCIYLFKFIYVENWWGFMKCKLTQYIDVKLCMLNLIVCFDYNPITVKLIVPQCTIILQICRGWELVLLLQVKTDLV